MDHLEDLNPSRLFLIAGDHSPVFQQKRQRRRPLDLFRDRTRRAARRHDVPCVIKNRDGGNFRLAGNLFHQLLKAFGIGGDEGKSARTLASIARMMTSPSRTRESSIRPLSRLIFR